MGLSDRQQAVLMFLAFFLPPLSVWLSLGAPADHTSLAYLGSALMGGVIAFIKEQLGNKAPVSPPGVMVPAQ